MPARISLTRLLQNSIRNSLAAIGIFAIGAGIGCGVSSKRPVSPPVYVRMEDLLPLHPAWNDIARLDFLIAQLSRPQEPVETWRQPAPQQVLPAALPPPSLKRAGLESMERARINRVVRQAMTRLNSLRNTLDVRENRLLALRRNAIEAQMQSDIAEYKAAAAANAKTEADTIRKTFHVPIRDLWLKQFALETQVNGLPAGAAREKAVQDLHTTEQQRIRLEAQLADRQAQAERSAQAALEEWIVTRQQRAADELASAQRDLRAHTEADIHASQQLAELILKGLEPLEPPAVAFPARQAGMAGLPPNLKGVRPQMHAPFGIMSTALRVALTELRAERARQVQLMSNDIRRRVQAIALEQGWQIFFHPVPGGYDKTREVAGKLRTGTYSFQVQTASLTNTIAP